MIENYIQENKLDYGRDGEATRVKLAIHGWATLVAPYTPTFCLELSSQDPILDNVSFLLSAMVFESDDPNHHGHLLSKILTLWPSISVWLQILHNDKMCPISLHGTRQAERERSENRYLSIYRVMMCFLQINSQIGLSTTVTYMEDVVTMAASMWIKESKNASSGFETSCFLACRKDGGLCPEAVAANIIDHIIVGCGSKEDVVELLFHRTKANLNQSNPVLRAMTYDLAFISNQAMNGASALQDTFLSNSAHTVICMIDILALLLSIQSKAAKHLETNPAMMTVIQEPLLVICRMLRSPRAYESIAQLLQASFFPLMARAALVCRPMALAKKFNGSLAQVLRILERFSIYRPFLSAIKRGLAAAALTTGRVPDGPIARSLRGFQKKIGHWYTMGKEYHDGWNGLVICGDPEVCLQYVTTAS